MNELARRMQQPNTKKNMQAPKRLVRFLKGSPRCVIATADKLNRKLWPSSQTATGHGV